MGALRILGGVGVVLVGLWAASMALGADRAAWPSATALACYGGLLALAGAYLAVRRERPQGWNAVLLSAAAFGASFAPTLTAVREVSEIGLAMSVGALSLVWTSHGTLFRETNHDETVSPGESAAALPQE